MGVQALAELHRPLRLGERPGSLALAGILIAIASIALISRQEDSAGTSPQRDRSIAIAIASGLASTIFVSARKPQNKFPAVNRFGRK